jgi:hypothetical protein
VWGSEDVAPRTSWSRNNIILFCLGFLLLYKTRVPSRTYKNYVCIAHISIPVSSLVSILDILDVAGISSVCNVTTNEERITF